MNCPAGCRTALVMSERSNIEIDYCPTCRGVWLDRGELDKILERSLAQETDAYRPGSGYDGHGSGHGSRGGEHGSQQYGSGRRRGSWLGELFGG